mmetsp:Transcript_139973/g.390213  ORF Transcript_139973/g.390213 Transcript_139973/m.390213 type:complete len:307 (-) Transcript_139973:88-1008(-)
MDREPPLRGCAEIERDRPRRSPAPRCGGWCCGTRALAKMSSASSSSLRRRAASSSAACRLADSSSASCWRFFSSRRAASLRASALASATCRLNAASSWAACHLAAPSSAIRRSFSSFARRCAASSAPALATGSPMSASAASAASCSRSASAAASSASAFSRAASARALRCAMRGQSLELKYRCCLSENKSMLSSTMETSFRPTRSGKPDANFLLTMMLYNSVEEARPSCTILQALVSHLGRASGFNVIAAFNSTVTSSASLSLSCGAGFRGGARALRETTSAGMRRCMGLASLASQIMAAMCWVDS